LFSFYRKSNPSLAAAGLAQAVSLKPAAPYDVLERYLHDLQHAERTARPFRIMLQAMRDGVSADAVFLYSFKAGELTDAIGLRSLTPAWCRQFSERLLGVLPAGAQAWVCPEAGRLAGSGSGPVVYSAALVRVSKAKEAWAVALSFASERLFGDDDLKVMRLARRMWLGQVHHQQTVDKLKETLIGVVHCLTAAVDAKDPYTSGHSERVARIAVQLGRQMGCSDAFVSEIYLAGLLHDIGKMGIKDSVLQKAGRLTDEEFQHVQQHPVIGDRIIAPVPELAAARPGVRNHHERYDGKGYPDGLAGEEIPLLARILAVADSCDAMMSARPYRTAMPTDQIDKIMQEGAGRQWDPRVIEHFMACRALLYPICQRGLGESIYVAVDHALRARDADISECVRRTPSQPADFRMQNHFEF
jgi:HD-GYP domain-containing protein (c-di-GMP phosphodiesterase class II)